MNGQDVAPKCLPILARLSCLSPSMCLAHEPSPTASLVALVALGCVLSRRGVFDGRVFCANNVFPGLFTMCCRTTLICKRFSSTTNPRQIPSH